MDEIGTDLYIKEASAKDMRPDVVTEMHNDMNKLHQCSAEETDRPLLMNKEILEATNDTSSIRSKPPQVKKSRDKNVCLTISTKINPITCKGKRKEKRTRQIVRLWLRCKLAHGQRWGYGWYAELLVVLVLMLLVLMVLVLMVLVLMVLVLMVFLLDS